MAATRRKGPAAQGIAIQLALAMMSDGRAQSKDQAAKMAGIQPDALKPSALRTFAERNPIGRAILPSPPDILTITEKVNGKSVSMREALSHGARTSLAILATLAPNLKRLTKAQDAQFHRAKRWLDLCRSCGLFAAAVPLALPSELQARPDSSPKPDGSVDEFLESHDEPDSSTEDEAITGTHNVEA